jgi:hypothetical protein
MFRRAAWSGPGCPPSLVRLRRVIGCLVVAAIAAGACVPAMASDPSGPLRQGKLLSRHVDQTPAVRTTHVLRGDSAAHRRGGSKAGSARFFDSLTPAETTIARLAVRSVHTLPGHWGARHLII